MAFGRVLTSCRLATGWTDPLRHSATAVGSRISSIRIAATSTNDSVSLPEDFTLGQNSGRRLRSGVARPIVPRVPDHAPPSSRPIASDAAMNFRQGQQAVGTDRIQDVGAFSPNATTSRMRTEMLETLFVSGPNGTTSVGAIAAADG